MGKIKLVSFADGRFSKRKVSFRHQAEEMDIFDEISIYDFQSLPNDFIASHRGFIENNARGFGYWIWKPRIVLETLIDSQSDDLIVYIDVGFTINSTGKKRLLEYLEITAQSSWKFLSFSNTHTEYRWTKADLAHRLSVQNNPGIMFTSQLASGLFFLKATAGNIDLMRDWSEISIENNYHYSDDSLSIVPNDADFVEHRHDQSIGSLLRKIRGTEITHYEVQSYQGHFEQIKEKLPFWATRSMK